MSSIPYKTEALMCHTGNNTAAAAGAVLNGPLNDDDLQQLRYCFLLNV